MAIITIQCKSANDIIDCLDPENFIWREKAEKHWIFRGQKNARWKLTPPAFRPNTQLDYHQRTKKAPLSNIEDQNRLEHRALNQFFRMAREVGEEAPEYCLTLSTQNGPCKEVAPTFRNGAWPPAFLMPAMAMAQHSGIPTRLLSFTYKPLYALFFAAMDAFRDPEPKTQIAVWGIDIDFLYTVNKRIYNRFEFVTLPGKDDRHLDNQYGVFVLDRSLNQYWPRLRPDYDQILSDLHEQHNDSPMYEDSIPPVYKLIVPVKEACEILIQLAEKDVTGAHLKPSYPEIAAWLKFKRQFL